MWNFEKKRSGWKEKILSFFFPIELKTIENEKNLDFEEKLLRLPKWKNKDKIQKRIEEIKRKEQTKQIILANEVKEYLGDEYFKEEKKELENRIKKYFVLEELEYLLNKQGINFENAEIYILANEYSKQMKEILEYFMAKFKLVHVLSKNQKYYTRWIERLEEDEQTNIIYSHNYRKSLLKAKMIINIDFSNQDLRKYKINQDAIILQLCQEKPELKQIFNGIYIMNTVLDYDKTRLGIYSDLNAFSFKEVYVSRINQETNIKEVWRKIKKDNIKVRYLEGINGKIEEKEYKTILKS